MTRLLPLVCLIMLGATAPAASAASAPARIAFAVTQQGFDSNSSAGSIAGAAALPGGGVLTFAYDAPTQTTLALRMLRNGSLDPSFGTGGVVRLPGAGREVRVSQAEPLPDGRLLLAAAMREPGAYTPQRIVLLRLLPNGDLDPSFGAGGAAPTGIIAPSDGAPMAVAADGSIVVTGSMLVTGDTNPLVPSRSDWVVGRLTANGAPDVGFGIVRIPVGSQLRATGTGVALTPTGSIVVLGNVTQTFNPRESALLAGLTATGAADPAFNGGAVQLVPLDGARVVRRRPGGSFELAGPQGVLRYTATGAPDATFATGGKLTFDRPVERLVPTPDGGALLQRSVGSEGAPADIDRRIAVQRLTAAGALGGSTTLYTPFGGGLARPDLRQEISVGQNAFSGLLLRRDDGSFLLLGGLSIHVPTGKMDVIRAPFTAAQAFTPALTPDRSFGGPQQPASLRVQIRRQRAKTAAARGYVSLRVTASQPGIVFLRVRDARGRVLASGTHPVFKAGATIMRVRMFARGRTLLERARRGARISVRYDFKDILAAPAKGVKRGRLG